MKSVVLGFVYKTGCSAFEIRSERRARQSAKGFCGSLAPITSRRLISEGDQSSSSAKEWKEGVGVTDTNRLKVEWQPYELMRGEGRTFPLLP